MADVASGESSECSERHVGDQTVVALTGGEVKTSQEQTVPRAQEVGTSVSTLPAHTEDSSGILLQQQAVGGQAREAQVSQGESAAHDTLSQGQASSTSQEQTSLVSTSQGQSSQVLTPQQGQVGAVITPQGQPNAVQASQGQLSAGQHSAVPTPQGPASAVPTPAYEQSPFITYTFQVPRGYIPVFPSFQPNQQLQYFGQQPKYSGQQLAQPVFMCQLPPASQLSTPSSVSPTSGGAQQNAQLPAHLSQPHPNLSQPHPNLSQPHPNLSQPHPQPSNSAPFVWSSQPPVVSSTQDSFAHWPTQSSPVFAPYSATPHAPQAMPQPSFLATPQAPPPSGVNVTLPPTRTQNSMPLQFSLQRGGRGTYAPLSNVDADNALPPDNILPPPYDATSYEPSPVLVQRQPRTSDTSRSLRSDHFMAVSVTTTLVCLLCATWSALLFTIPAIYCAWKSGEAERNGDIFKMRSSERSALAFNIAGIMFGIATWVVVSVTCIAFFA